jgi:hypothetical protein
MLLSIKPAPLADQCRHAALRDHPLESVVTQAARFKLAVALSYTAFEFIGIRIDHQDWLSPDLLPVCAGRSYPSPLVLQLLQ